MRKKILCKGAVNPYKIFHKLLISYIIEDIRKPYTEASPNSPSSTETNYKKL